MDLESMVSVQKFAEKISDVIGEAIWLSINHHSGSAVEIPAKNHDRLLSANCCCTKGSKVCVSIDKVGGMPSLFDMLTFGSRVKIAACRGGNRT
jgi:hypothetical protein